jgi:uncharacterized protein Yka (UPF0111/DUF47 family)
MTNRDEYLNKFKAKLDQWDAEIDKFEAKADEAQADARLQYHKQLDTMREQRDIALKRYNEMQNAAADAWETMVQGTEKAWTAWLDAFEDARAKFTSKG